MNRGQLFSRFKLLNDICPSGFQSEGVYKLKEEKRDQNAASFSSRRHNCLTVKVLPKECPVVNEKRSPLKSLLSNIEA